MIQYVIIIIVIRLFLLLIPKQNFKLFSVIIYLWILYYFSNYKILKWLSLIIPTYNRYCHPECRFYIVEIRKQF